VLENNSKYISIIHPMFHGLGAGQQGSNVPLSGWFAARPLML
jgi:hypothetical protein